MTNEHLSHLTGPDKDEEERRQLAVARAYLLEIQAVIGN